MCSMYSYRTFDEMEVIDLDKKTDGTEICPKRFKGHEETKSVADVVKSLTERVDENGIFSICVTRDQMLERGIKQWQRQKKSSPKHPLRVSFIGEAGIDNGALRKEFLTEMMAGIEKRFFDGGDNGKNPKYSMTDLDKHNFKTVGEIFAVSIAQGGPPPNFLMQWCYNYISTGEVDQEAISERDVTDPELIQLIKEIEAADNTTLMEFTDRILSCGYTGAMSTQRKEDIVRSLVLHSTVRLLPMLQQICSGMKLYGLLSLVQQETDICRQLFVPGSFSKMDSDFLVKSLSPVFSEKGTMRHQRESKVVNFLQDFIQDLEDEEGGKNNREDMPEETKSEDEDIMKAERHTNNMNITVGKFCQWLTGQGHIPLSHSEREGFRIIIEFDHDCQVRYGTHHSICYPVVNACSCSVTFPIAHLSTYVEFKNIISQAIVHGFEFGRC
ncbi:G2/M phase-specific E3 ubiquitin-protein ligase-like isoform X2 [Paramormyrops kingsleyae]|uniref:G2/M phase-specific E3 ubiquitin-protein ligase-like isoform X2 n=1 Tax=Paramormyrops kingsleyae TaxID=1676925 RepID=UPI003B96EDCA